MSGFTHYVKAPGLTPVGCHSLEKAERLIERHGRTAEGAIIMTRAEHLAWQNELLASPTRVAGFTIGL